MKKKIQIILGMALLILAISSCSSSKQSCAAYGNVEVEMDSDQ